MYANHRLVAMHGSQERMRRQRNKVVIVERFLGQRRSLFQALQQNAISSLLCERESA